MEKNTNTQTSIDRKLFFAAKRYCEEMDKKPDEQRSDLYYALQAWCEKHPQEPEPLQQETAPKLEDVEVEEDLTPDSGETYEVNYTMCQDHKQEVFSKAKYEDPYMEAKARYNELLEAADNIELWQLDPYTGKRALMILSRTA